MLGIEQRSHPGLVAAEVALAFLEDQADLVVGQRVGDIERARSQVAVRSGQHQPTAADPYLGEVVEEDRLVREDVGGVAAEVVLLEQVVVEEARRPGARHHERRVEDLDVALGPGQLDDPLLMAEGDLRLRRELVHHRVPDRAGELEEEQIERPEGEELVGVGRPRVVHVEDPDLAVVDEEGRVAERSVGRRVEGHDHDPETAVELERLAVGGLDEPPEAELVELVAEVVDRVVGQDDGRVLRAVGAQPGADRSGRDGDG